MIKNLYFYIFLGLVALYFFYVQSAYNYVEGYRNAKVFIGKTLDPKNGLIYMNENNFGSHSIYETGIVRKPNINIYANSYPGNYPGYYS